MFHFIKQLPIIYRSVIIIKKEEMLRGCYAVFICFGQCLSFCFGNDIFINVINPLNKCLIFGNDRSSAPHFLNVSGYMVQMSSY